MLPKLEIPDTYKFSRLRLVTSKSVTVATPACKCVTVANPIVVNPRYALVTVANPISADPIVVTPR